MEISCVSVCIPTHCSALSKLPLARPMDLLRRGGAIKRTNDDTAIDRSAVLYIQCHLDRIVWNIFRPLFYNETDAGDIGANTGTSNTSTANCSRNYKDNAAVSALLCLILHYQKQIHILPPESSDRIVHVDENDVTCTPKNSEKEEGPILWEKFRYFLNNFTCTPFLSNHKTRKEKYNTTHLQIYILPPYNLQTANPYHQSHRPRLGTRIQTLRPEHIFTSALVRQENLHIKLQTLNAFIATHGGGYFLCRFLSTAVKFAQYQRQIALALDDVPLALKCTINESYNYIHAGEIDHAKRLISAVEKEVERKLELSRRTVGGISRQDDYEVILGMCHSAMWFAEKVREAGLKEKNLEGGRQATNDDFLRIRVIKDKDAVGKIID